MIRPSRRFFLLSAVAASAGCALRARGISSHDEPSAPVRAPVVGQTWRYSKHDLFSGALVDDQTDHVTAVGDSIDIESRADSGKDTSSTGSSWGNTLLRKFRGIDAAGAALPSEIQSPWGMVSVDPHWSEPQAYERPIPLWPTQLRPGWRMHIQTRYKTAADGPSLSWDQRMEAHEWERISTPGGQFNALRVTSMIDFDHPDPARTDSVRRETLWFAPEVGRWVVRESAGTYYLEDSVDDTSRNESSYRWTLIEWS